MMLLSDKLLILLNFTPCAANLGVSRGELCEQLGKSWEELQETVGVLRSLGYVNCDNRHSETGVRTMEWEYWLTPTGCKELERRKKQAISVHI